MAAGQHARLEIGTVGPVGAKGQHARAELTAAVTAVDTQHSRLELSATAIPVNGQHARLEVLSESAFPVNTVHARLELATPASVSAGADMVNTEPGDTVTLTGSGGNGGTPSWTQVSGTAVVLTVVGSAVSFRVPATNTGDTLVFRFGVSGATDSVSVSVLPTLEWAVRAGVLVPRLAFAKSGM